MNRSSLHSASDTCVKADRQRMSQWLQRQPDTESVAHFKSGPGIEKLSLTFDIDQLRSALQQVLNRTDLQG